jgi:dienelactone hydrolase
MMAPLGRNLARMGYCVVIPDLIAFGDEVATDMSNNSSQQTHSRRRSSSGYTPSRIKESVQELRAVMRWAYDNGAYVDDTY